ncbi:MAG: transposase [Planctomycetaceae bacterium]|nr:transposase [Planctomycetaceae bacterium]
MANAFSAAPRDVQRFAQELLRDRQAVANALTSRWSNGPTEAHVNRLKLIKKADARQGELRLAPHPFSGIRLTRPLQHSASRRTRR